MRLYLVLVWALILWATVCSRQPASAQDAAIAPPGITCDAFLIYDLDNERIVSVYGPQVKQPIASLSKLMTAILACEYLRFDGRYILTDNEQEKFKAETMRAEQMLSLMLVPSNNSVCKVVARIISGNEQEFAGLMNRRARELGMQNTRFVNSTGLPQNDQYSTLGDVLILTRAALSYPPILSAMSSAEVEFGGRKYEGTLKPLYDRHNGLLGGKTGYTRAAGRCLSLLYESYGRQYIFITLGSNSIDEGFHDAELILSYYGLYGGSVGEW